MLQNFSTIFQGIAEGGEPARNARPYPPVPPGFGRRGAVDEDHGHHGGPGRDMNYPYALSISLFSNPMFRC